MSPKEINAAIAEHCGWTPNFGYASLLAGNLFGCAPGEDARYSWKRVPNYCGSLDAMHGAEIALDDRLRMKFRANLSRPYKAKGVLITESVHATVSERAEAFLRTVGKWEEAKP